MQQLLKKWVKHIVAILVLLIVTIAYFSPSVLDGKMLRQGDDIKATGMGQSQMKEFEESAAPGEFSAWSDAMFGGMPYIAGYGNPAPDLPRYSIIDKLFKSLSYSDASMIFIGLVSFYLLMCVMGASWWLALAGAFAFALASYNIIIIEAGHIVKGYVIGYMPVTLAGMTLLFKRKYLWGAILFLLGVALSISNNHIQITYYLFLLCLFIYMGYLVAKVKAKEFAELGKVTAIMAVCAIVAVLPGVKTLYSNWELGEHSIRGESELTPKPNAAGVVEKKSSGLDKDYAFAWSYGKAELLTTLVPNVYGGGSGGTLGQDSEFYKEAKAAGAKLGKEIQAPTYWGDKVFTSGPVYFGAIVCFLFVLGMFVVKNPMKWWLFAGALFMTLLAFGRNLDGFNDFMFHHLPMYNKFRTVEMALVIPNMVAPIIGIWGLMEIFSGKVERKTFMRGFYVSLALTGGLSLLLWLSPTLLLDFHSSYDAQYQLPENFYNALLMDRASLASSDALRSLLFILIGAALLAWYAVSKDKKSTATYVSIAMAVLIGVDLWGVDKRYLNEGSFYPKQDIKNVYTESTADKVILQDKSNYRVVNLNNPFQETQTSYFHHSVGGYHAAKLRRYNELIEHRLQGELNAIIDVFGEAKSLEDFMPVFAVCPTLNMLNTRYIIYNPQQPPLVNPYADGNAWFATELSLVENADEEIAALDKIDPKKTAVVDKRFSAQLSGFTPQTDSTATIQLDSYRPNKLVYSSEAQTEQLAVFSEIYYQPGWKVTIDGKQVDYFRADWILRAMRIPAGKHEIVFEFKPEGYIVAANVSAYSSFLILLMLIGAVGYSIWNELKNKPENE